jgi:hypothetical protein
MIMGARMVVTTVGPPTKGRKTIPISARRSKASRFWMSEKGGCTFR